jgi:hypothetical protein
MSAGMTPEQIITAAYEAGVIHGYRQATADTDMVEQALADTGPLPQTPWRKAPEFAAQQQAADEITSPSHLPPRAGIEREHVRLLAYEIAPLPEDGQGGPAHYLGRTEPLRDLLAGALAQARGDHLGVVAVAAHWNPEQVAMVAVIVVADYLAEISATGDLCLACAAELVARPAESSR